MLFDHTDFMPVVEAGQVQLETVRTFVWIDEEGSEVATHSIPFSTEYAAMLAAISENYEFPDFDENTRATAFYTTGTTGSETGAAAKISSRRWRSRLPSMSVAHRSTRCESRMLTPPKWRSITNTLEGD
jgi:hypothetical protein